MAVSRALTTRWDLDRVDVPDHDALGETVHRTTSDELAFTGEGTLSPCSVKDAFSNRIVGYCAGSRMPTALAVNARVTPSSDADLGQRRCAESEDPNVEQVAASTSSVDRASRARRATSAPRTRTRPWGRSTRWGSTTSSVVGAGNPATTRTSPQSPRWRGPITAEAVSAAGSHRSGVGPSPPVEKGTSSCQPLWSTKPGAAPSPAEGSTARDSSPSSLARSVTTGWEPRPRCPGVCARRKRALWRHPRRASWAAPPPLR